MREGWRDVAVSDVVYRSEERLGTAPEPIILTCSEGAGLIPQTDKFKKRIAADDTSDYKVVRFGDVVYNPYLLWKGAIAQSQHTAPGITSPVYEVLRPRAEVSARFLGLALCHDAAIRQFDAISIGSIERRRRAVLPEVMKVTIPLPALAEQRRIVDLIGSVDLTHEQARKTLTSVELTQRAVLLDLFGREPVVWVPLVEVLEDLIGGVWGRPPGEDEVDVAALGLTAFNAPTARVDRDQSTPRSVNRERWSRRGLRADDIILERSGGTNDRPVGRVIAAQADMLDVIPTDFMRLLRVDPSRALPRYVFWWLWVRYQRGDTLAFQSKTTNIRNLRVTDYLALPLPMSSRDVQSRVVAVAEELAALTEAALGVVDRLARVRSALLADLLSGEHEIPATYDRFIDGAA
jgi:type I restriction enzyme, S subunit